MSIKQTKKLISNILSEQLKSPKPIKRNIPPSISKPSVSAKVTKSVEYKQNQYEFMRKSGQPSSSKRF